jgi:hypothetical protein
MARDERVALAIQRANGAVDGQVAEDDGAGQLAVVRQQRLDGVLDGLLDLGADLSHPLADVIEVVLQALLVVRHRALPDHN